MYNVFYFIFPEIFAALINIYLSKLFAGAAASDRKSVNYRTAGRVHFSSKTRVRVFSFSRRRRPRAPPLVFFNGVRVRPIYSRQFIAGTRAAASFLPGHHRGASHMVSYVIIVHAARMHTPHRRRINNL